MDEIKVSNALVKKENIRVDYLDDGYRNSEHDEIELSEAGTYLAGSWDMGEMVYLPDSGFLKLVLELDPDTSMEVYIPREGIVWMEN